MLVYITTSGSHGDVHPFLAIGRALAARGHEVVVFTIPHYAADLEAAGLGHRPICPDVDHEALLRDPRLMDAWRGGPLVMKMILDSAPSAIATIRGEVERRRPDVVLSHHVCFGTRWICEAAGVPLALAVLAPMFWFAPDDPAPTLQQRPGRFAAVRARWTMTALRPLIPLVADRVVNRLRRRTGYPPERGVCLRDLHGGDVNLGLWSPHLRASSRHDPPNTQICGFPWYDRADVGATLEPALEAFLEAGDRPVVFTLGTAAVHCPGDFYEIATDACTRLGCRGVLLTGAPDRVPAGLPPTVAAFDYAPFSLLLPRSGAAVHHGGIGSTAQALRAGCPSVVVPHAHDQFNNAVRVHALGAGAMIHRRHLTAARLADALRTVLEDPTVSARCAGLGRALENEDGAAVAADAVEALARGN